MLVYNGKRVNGEVTESILATSDDPTSSDNAQGEEKLLGFDREAFGRC